MGNNIQGFDLRINKQAKGGKRPVAMTKKKPDTDPVIYASTKCIIKKQKTPVVVAPAEPETSVTVTPNPNYVPPVIVEEPQVVATVEATPEPVVETWKEKRERTKKKSEETFENDTKV
jgi:hypothetical protein